MLDDIIADDIAQGIRIPIELPAVLALLLRADLCGAAERKCERLLESRLSFDLAAYIADDAAQPAAQDAQLPLMPLELLGIPQTKSQGSRAQSIEILQSGNAPSPKLSKIYLSTPQGKKPSEERKLLYVFASGQQGGDEVYAYDDPAAPAHASPADGSRRNRLGTEPRPSWMDAVLRQIWAVRNAQPY